MPHGLRIPRLPGKAGTPVAAVSLPGRRAAGGRPQGRPEGVEKSLPVPQQHGHNGAGRRHAAPASPASRTVASLVEHLLRGRVVEIMTWGTKPFEFAHFTDQQLADALLNIALSCPDAAVPVGGCLAF
jgi:hypothetical protein